MDGVRTIHSKRHKSLVLLIKREREARGLSQTTVAKRLRQHQSWFARLESGQRRLDVVEFLDIAKAIGFDPVEAIRKLTGLGNNG